MKRQKMRPSDLSELGIWYHDSYRTRRPDNTLATKFIIDKPLTVEQAQAIAQYKNVIRGSVSYHYAPEIRYETLILTDKILPV